MDDDDQDRCPVYFLASDVRLPPIALKKQGQPFWVKELTAAERKTFPQFSKQHVYVVGSHTGCCCGFVDWPTPEADDWTRNRRGEKSAWKTAVLRNAAARRSESLRQLARYLSDALEHAGEIESFYCWEGQEGDEPSRRRKASLEELVAIDFALDERELVTIKKSRA